MKYSGPAAPTRPDDEDHYIGILGHLDVVPALEGWTSDPFVPVEREGRIYARGILDNKGPILSCLYALKAIKDLRLEIQHPIWILFGTNEETGMADIPLYLAQKRPPIAGWTPDCKFPVVYAERGRANFELESPDLETMEQWLNRYFLSGQPKEKALKLAYTDAEFGTLEIVNTRLKGLTISFAISYPHSLTIEDLERSLQERLYAGQTLQRVRHFPPVCFSKEGPLCQILLSSYEDGTKEQGDIVVTSGGTYAKVMPHIVPFGPSFPGQKGIAHLPDEWMNIQDLLVNARIYALAMLRLANCADLSDHQS